MQNFDTPAPISTSLQIPAGRVRLIATDRADTTVDVRPSDAGKGRDVKAAELTVVAYIDGVLRIQTTGQKNQYFGSSGSVDVTVELPEGSRVEAKTASAELSTVGRLGDVVFDGAYRQIKVDEAASLRLTAVDGDVEVGKLGGAAEISTSRGDIRIAEAVRGSVVLRTHDGSISVTAAEGVSGTLDASTSYGRVSNAMKNDGKPGLDVRATTSRGDIVASSR